MKRYSKIKNCSHFKPLNDSMSYYRNNPVQNCKECIYFSSRNCGMDIADSIDTDFDFI